MAVRRRRSEENFKIIFVSGYAGAGGADPDYVKDCWWGLQSYIRDLSQRHREMEIDDCLCVVNKSSLKNVDEKNVRELQQMLLDMPVDGAGIVRIIFAHSHGASVVYDALKEASLIPFLKSKRICETDKKIKQIRGHLAVFTLGGIQDIPDAFAKISCNFLFTIDLVAKIGMKIYAEKHQQEVNTKEFGIVDTAFDEAVNVMVSAQQALSNFEELMKYVASLVPVLSGASAALVSSAASNSYGMHCFKKYMASGEIMREILCILKSEDDVNRM